MMIRILVVEDEPGIAFGLRSDLTLEGYSVEVAEDGLTASRRAAETTFDLILLDVMLPQKDGLAVARDLRRNGFKTPIILLTARALEDEKILGLETGADDYITKPFSPPELRARIKAVLRRFAEPAGFDNQRELDSARRIQQRLIPSAIPRFNGLRIAGAWRPARTVSGDYFDVLRFDDDTVAVCIADVCGKGMPAAMMMANLQAAVKTAVANRLGPSELCASVNRIMCGNMSGGGFITFFYAVLSDTLTYCNAGHNPPFLIRPDGAVTRLDCGGGILGVFAHWNYEQQEVRPGPGDRLLMYTDGVTENRNAEGEEFGEQRLAALAAGSSSATALTQAVIAAASAFSNGNFEDDVTVLAVSADR
jgi:sigma-B regulation protein RsbU (phosphoserine phosphatase)